MRRILVSIVLLFAGVGSVNASVLYEFEWGGAFGINANWSFATADILSATTTVSGVDLLTANTDWLDGIISSVTIQDPFGPVPQIITNQQGGLANFADFGFSAVAPFDHFGTYTSLGGSVLKISRSGVPVPEPDILALFSVGMLLAGFASRRQRR